MNVAIDNSSFHAEIVPEIGANVVLLRHRASGTVLLREPPEPEELRRFPEQFGMPVLFPPNRIEDGTFTFEGRICRLPLTDGERHNHLHGLAVGKAWQLIAADERSAELRFVFGKEDPLYEGFPFVFTLTRRVELTETGLTDQMTVENNGNWDMPLGLGYHTTFPAAGAAVRMNAGEGELEVDERMLPTGNVLPWKTLDPREFFIPVGQVVGFHCRASKQGFHGAEIRYPAGMLRYITDPKFGFWYTWNKRGLGDFVSLEPVSWMANALNRPEPPSETGLRILAPQAHAVFRNELQFLL